MGKRKVIFSYDYELFFGVRSGTVRKTLIEPTSLLLDGMERCGAKGNFFVDCSMLTAMSRQGEALIEDYGLILNQLKDIVRRGHRIELHLHPHWEDAVYNGDGTWDFGNFSRYSLSAFSSEEVLDMFEKGTELLNGLASQVSPGYRVCAFRAGGWAVQPFANLAEAFFKTGITIDSSVARGLEYRDDYSAYDFTGAPDKSLFRFEGDVCREDRSGRFIEVPITTYSRCLAYRGVDFISRRISRKKLSVITDGTHCRPDLPPAVTPRTSKAMFTLSRISPLSVAAAFFLNNRKGEVSVFIDHPKDFTYSALDAMKYIMKHAESITYKDCLELV